MSETPQVDEIGVIIGRTKGFLLSDRTAHDAVDALADVARDVIAHAEGAGVSLIQNGTRISVGSTDAKVLEADTLQYSLREGPCLSAWADVRPVIISDTTTDTRWKDWSGAAAQAGVRSCLSVPLLQRSKSIGAMKVYSSSPTAFGEVDQRLLVNLAKSAAALLGHVQASDTPQRISDTVKESLTSRDTIGMARGILMERHDLDRDEALTRIATLSSAQHVSISDTASSIARRQDGADTSGTP